MIKKLFLAFFCFVFLGCSHPVVFKETRVMMDTFVEITCFSSDKDLALDAMREAFKEIGRIEKLLSRFDSKSAISEINNLAGLKDVVVDSEVLGIIERSLKYSGLSNGSFDITVAPVVDIWKGMTKDGVVPDDEVRANALAKIGYKNIVIDKKAESIRFLNKDTRIDLGGIAKGYAVDRAKEILLGRGIRNVLINIGGNMFALGNPPGGKLWQIGIQDPKNKKKILYKLSLKDKAISTSGSYERPNHIINPKTGLPIDEIQSVTIVSDTGESADALSTTVFVMGIKDGLALIKRSFKDVEVYIYDSNKNFVRYP